jgi:NADH:ubiquinone oxidoreductase subunit C
MDTQTALQNARLIVEDMSDKVESPETDRLDFYLKNKKNLVAAAAGLRVQHLGYLAAITGLDPGAEQEVLEVLYHFCTGYVTITLRVNIPKATPSIPTLTEIIPGAEPFERELSEMFGITISGLRNPERLYLPDDWAEGDYPLRKDFQLQVQPAQSQTKVN